MESGKNYILLKDHKGMVPVKAEEVLKPIFCRGLLTKRETQVVWAIIADSWRWGNSQFTQRPVTLGTLSRDTGLDKGTLSRTVRRLVDREIIKFNRANQVSFDEHFEHWKGVGKTATPKPKSANNNTDSGVGKTPKKVGETPTGVGKTATPKPRSHIDITKRSDGLRTIYKNKEQLKDTRSAASPLTEFQILDAAVREKFRLVTDAPKAKRQHQQKVAVALNQCREKNLNPLDLVALADRNWFGYIRTACGNGDSFRDGERVRPYHTILDGVGENR